MKLFYDLRGNVAYISLHSCHKPSQTFQIAEDAYIDVSLDGQLQGIELLNITRQLAADGGFVIQLINEATKAVQFVSLD